MHTVELLFDKRQLFLWTSIGFERSGMSQFITFAPMIMIYVFLIINLIAFIIFGWDKRLAVRHQRRVPENTLLGLAFMGGTAGAGLGMLLFRHKISKRSFLLKFAGIILIQALGIFFFVKYWMD